MPTTPLDQCYQCEGFILVARNPWTFHQRTKDGELYDVAVFCNINCIAAYYKLGPWHGRAHVTGMRVVDPDASNS